GIRDFHVTGVQTCALPIYLGFRGNEQNYYDPANSYFNRVIDRRTGNPISLCLLFMLLGRRLEMPIAGIGFPGHFLCRYQTSQEEDRKSVVEGKKVGRGGWR